MASTQDECSQLEKFYLFMLPDESEGKQRNLQQKQNGKVKELNSQVDYCRLLPLLLFILFRSGEDLMKYLHALAKT
ncbi:CLUMA_CG001749, isoform A [Clunio marinus]|uniref:CLUMA_CG001749, isoform A n=1 Tax=Clunio marinus TaxID=568069 RepID=A0A1J1HJ74_9DIPT|nr:CLUMA_CG001749, isoform A [Clunio marinus]